MKDRKKCRHKRIPRICENPECGRSFMAPLCDVKRGNGRYCSRNCASRHRFIKGELKLTINRKGKDNPNWKGGATVHSDGYIYCFKPDHPHASNGYVFQHRLVMEEKIGRYLKPDEVVHHIDGNKTNNNPDNLLLTTCSEHTRLHNEIRAQRMKVISIPCHCDTTPNTHRR
ncbi:HNH endonuclease signature motif containing protein [Pelotomaculum propionicicum]|uniref:HNH nuclease domain-containing protein n=1 Tax=Pelotomaculum propionicicum TaxID=258475 RepID=A0A4Y7RJL8_9FIRM|nr:hypothetical protein Pmgp_03320 [Pelotomaculum propionicicum]